jgi:hypothetical protein
MVPLSSSLDRFPLRQSRSSLLVSVAQPFATSKRLATDLPLAAVARETFGTTRTWNRVAPPFRGKYFTSTIFHSRQTRFCLILGTMDRIEALQKRVAELEQRRADMERRQAEEGADSAERLHTHRQRRLEILRRPITTHLKLAPSVHCDAVDVASHEVWVEQVRLRIASLKKAFN